MDRPDSEENPFLRIGFCYNWSGADLRLQMKMKFILVLGLAISLAGAGSTAGAGEETKTQAIQTTVKLSFGPKVETKKVTVGKRTYKVNIVTLPKEIGVGVGIANNKIGQSSSLKDIAKLAGADFAINATYFDAYGDLPEPYGMLIKEGRLAHIGNLGTSIGFTTDGKVLMDNLRVSVNGTVKNEEKSSSWYIYFMNRTPAKTASCATMFTPERGGKIGFNYGNMVTVEDGIVTKLSQNINAEIPKNGYVLVFNGNDSGQYKRFEVGAEVDFTVNYTDLQGNPVSWEQVHTAVGAGPRLVKDGKLAVNPAAEGFSSSKILTDGGARSGIAIKEDGTILLATVGGATIRQWAEVMLKLGAEQAMNLDGGASSGLFANGKLVTPAGRMLSNTLVFGQHLK